MDNARNMNEASKGVVKGLLNTGSITAAFAKLGKGKVIFCTGNIPKQKPKLRLYVGSQRTLNPSKLSVIEGSKIL